MNKLEKIISTSDNDLINILKSIDISVPKRTDGREKENAEIWSICHLLSAFINEKLLLYPLELIHREKPDFQLILGNKNIGVEFTEFTSEKYSRAIALSENDLNPVIEPSLFKRSTPEMNNNEIISKINQSSKRLIGLPEVGDNPEIEWVNEIFHDINVKLMKLNTNDFNKYDDNWLLIYDNYPTVPLDINKILKYMKMKLIDYWMNSLKYKYIFNTIIIETDGGLITIIPYGIKLLSKNDLWKKCA